MQGVQNGISQQSKPIHSHDNARGRSWGVQMHILQQKIHSRVLLQETLADTQEIGNWRRNLKVITNLINTCGTEDEE